MLLCMACGGCGTTVENIRGSGMAAGQDSKDQTDAGEDLRKSASRDIFAMDTYMTITCYGANCEAAADAAEEEIHRLDRLLSVGNPESEISRLNESGTAQLSEDSQIMVEQSLKLYQDTEGAFDISVYPLMVLWGFTSGEYTVPSKEEIAETLERTGSGRMQYENGCLTLAEGQGIDLGGIAKGYTSDRLMEIFADYGLTSAIISLGGNVQLYQCKPDGSLWKCGIRNPDQEGDPSEMMGILQARDCAVITSGAYERYFEGADGTVYHHIIDPSTGFPAKHGLKSVTVVSRNGMLADGLSTACYVMGLEKTLDFWRSSEEEFDLILMTDDNEIYITEGITEQFETEYPVVRVEKQGAANE